MASFDETITDMDSVVDSAGQDVTAALEGLKNGNIDAAWPLIQNYLLPAAGIVFSADRCLYGREVCRAHGQFTGL